MSDPEAFSSQPDQPATEFQPDYLLKGVFRAAAPLLWPIVKGVIWLDNQSIKTEDRIGLLSDSIIAPTIHFPDRDRSDLVQCTAEEGEVAAYDFEWSRKFGEDYHTSGWDYDVGKMSALLLDRVMDNPAGHYTPLEWVDFTKLRSVFRLSWVSLGDAVSLNLIAERSYGDAYAIAGELNNWEHRLRHYGLIDEPVYQVTRKGNGLIDLVHSLPTQLTRTKRSPTV